MNLNIKFIITIIFWMLASQKLIAQSIDWYPSYYNIFLINDKKNTDTVKRYLRLKKNDLLISKSKYYPDGSPEFTVKYNLNIDQSSTTKADSIYYKFDNTDSLKTVVHIEYFNFRNNNWISNMNEIIHDSLESITSTIIRNKTDTIQYLVIDKLLNEAIGQGYKLSTDKDSIHHLFNYDNIQTFNSQYFTSKVKSTKPAPPLKYDGIDFKELGYLHSAKSDVYFRKYSNKFLPKNGYSIYTYFKKNDFDQIEHIVINNYNSNLQPSLFDEHLHEVDYIQVLESFFIYDKNSELKHRIDLVIDNYNTNYFSTNYFKNKKNLDQVLFYKVTSEFEGKNSLVKTYQPLVFKNKVNKEIVGIYVEKTYRSPIYRIISFLKNVKFKKKGKAIKVIEKYTYY